MQNKLHRKLMIISLVLVAFGFFYFLQDRMAREYVGRTDRARAAGIQDSAWEDLLFVDALGKGNGGREIAMRRAEALLAHADYDAAEQELLRSAPALDATEYAFLARIRYASGDYAGAEEYYALACEKEPTADLLQSRAKNLVRLGRTAEALAMLEAAADAFDDDALDYYLELLRLDTGEFEADDMEDPQSEEYAAKSSLIRAFWEEGGRDDSVFYIVRRAEFFLLLKEADLALADIDRAIGRDKNYRDAYLIKGKALLLDGRTEEAAYAFEKALGLDADNAEAIHYLGGIREYQGDTARADEYQARYEYLSK